MAMLESEKIKKISSKKLAVCIFALSIYYLLMIGLQKIQGKGFANSVYELIINVAIMIAWLLILNVIKSVKLNSIAKFVIAVSLIIAELVFSGQSILTGMLIHREWYENYAFNLKNNAVTIAAMDSSFYRVISVGDEVTNSSLLFDYNGVDFFATCRNENLSTTLERLGFANSPRFMTSSGSTPVSRMLFGVKYMINPGNYNEQNEKFQVTIPTVNKIICLNLL